MTRRTYDSILAYYGEQEDGLGELRRLSPESDYGVWWYEGGRNMPPWRVSFVDKTMEVYTICQGPGSYSGHVELLAEGCPKQEVEGLLEGWAERCGEAGSLHWVRRQLDAWAP